MGCFGSSHDMFWLIILMFAVETFRVHGEAPLGFISIDCGKNHTYTDDITKIEYTSDAQFIDRGVDYDVSSSYTKPYFPGEQLLNLRSFPNGSRSCYTLGPTIKYSKYLVRASFLYGNYDDLNSASTTKPLMFDLHLDADYWMTINITDAGRYYWNEVITVAKGNSISVCLVNVGSGTPFISALELRPLQNGMYMYANVTQSLVKVYRSNAGSNSIVRYPDDPYDRIWWPWILESWSPISTNAISISHLPDDQFFAPLAVMKTAVVPINSNILGFQWDYADTGVKNNQFYATLHFMEVQQNTRRVFNIYLNNKLWYRNRTAGYLLETYTWSTYLEKSNDTKYIWALDSTGLSTFPPILNALEVYSPLTHVEVTTDSGDVDAIKNIKMQYQIKKNWMGDPCAPKQYIWDGINCDYASTSSRITDINLSSSGLTGFISSYFTNLTELKYLDLSNNNLTGPIPEDLGNLVSLKVLNISCNNFSGTIPSSLLERSQQGLLRFSNDSNPCSNVPVPPGQSPSGNDKKIAIVVPVAVVATVLLLILVILVWRTRKLQGFDTITPTYPQSPENTKRDNLPFQLEGRQFTYIQLTKITNNFANVIGKGGFGIVYLGYLENGEQVATKMCDKSSRQGTREFLAEVQNLTRIHHRNLVSLIGYCMDRDHLALVYEYMSQGSLHEHLRGNVGKPGIINWRERLRIAVEAAQGLEYLHRGCNPPIVHRDIKTNNILLSSALEAKIADFGLSRAFISNIQTHVSTMSLAGTPGYVDPEYHSTLQLTEKSDVYSFGVVLLELITGLPPIMPNSSAGHIVHRVSPSLARGDLTDIVDERLRGKYDANSVWTVLDLAMKCTAQTGKQRPTMSYVVSQLKNCLELVIASEKNDHSCNTQDSFTSQSTAVEIGMSISESFGPSAR